MIEAIFVAWDTARQSGTARSSDGNEYQLRYQDGQSFFTDRKHIFPQLTGRHEQPVDGQLKMPMVGDPILVQPSASRQGTLPWAYMRSYLDAAQRRHGTQFGTTE